MEPVIIIAGYLIGINLVAFCLYGMDKHKAKTGAWRISERTLILAAVFGGSVGAWLGMQMFRHKTKHPKFYIGVPVIFVLQLAVAVAIAF